MSLWRQHSLAVNFDVDHLLDSLDLGSLWDDLEDDVLGALIPSRRLVTLNQSRLDLLEGNRGLYRFTVGHEIGHWILHCEDERANNLALFAGERILCRQRSKEPLEVQAEKFAGHLLAPIDQLRARLPSRPWTGWTPVYKLAEGFGMSVSAMLVRLKETKFAYKDDAGVPCSGQPAPKGQLELGV